MRRSRWAVAAACGLLAALLAGCGNPAGVDGDLVDDWAPLAEAKTFVPESGVCHQAPFAEFASLSAYGPIDCAQPHRGETFHIGTFTGAAAQRGTPPTRTSAESRTAYATCEEQARAFLGEDFRYGRLWLGVVLPSSSGWTGGARWFRCDLFQVANVENYGDPVEREGSLKGALAAGSALRLGCYQVTADADGSIKKMTGVTCGRAHNSEFVGVYRAPVTAKYPASNADWDRLHTACRKVVAGYVRLPADEDLQFRTGTVVVPSLEAEWNAGNHGVRCYLYVRTEKFTRSLKGAGAKALPAD